MMKNLIKCCGLILIFSAGGANSESFPGNVTGKAVAGNHSIPVPEKKIQKQFTPAELSSYDSLSKEKGSVKKEQKASAHLKQPLIDDKADIPKPAPVGEGVLRMRTP